MRDPGSRDPVESEAGGLSPPAFCFSFTFYLLP